MKRKIKTIGIIAPCGNIKDKEILDKKIKILEKKFKVKKYFNINTENNYLSDSDENRISYLEKAFSDDEVDLVMNVRGGYGAIRIVDNINYDKIKKCGKYYLASSDATILLSALNKKTNIKCFHGLMLTNGFSENLDKNIEIIENNIFNISLSEIIRRSPSHKGILWGGNLSSIVSMLSGSIYLPDKDIILFLEDLNEPLYKIDKMFFEIYRCKKLKEKIKSIIFGDFYLKDDEIMPLLKEYARKFNVNCYKSKDITHKSNNITIPFGKIIEL